jgi:hypothetical protein
MLEDHINELLVQWDPIEVRVGGGPVYHEYRSYVPRLIAVLFDKTEIKKLLEHIVTEEMELTYDKHNPTHVSEIEKLSETLNKLQRE